MTFSTVDSTFNTQHSGSVMLFWLWGILFHPHAPQAILWYRHARRNAGWTCSAVCTGVHLSACMLAWEWYICVFTPRHTHMCSRCMPLVQTVLCPTSWNVGDYNTQPRHLRHWAITFASWETTHHQNSEVFTSVHRHVTVMARAGPIFARVLSKFPNFSNFLVVY